MEKNAILRMSSITIFLKKPALKMEIQPIQPEFYL